MRLIDPLAAGTMAPLGVVLGVGGVFALELAFFGTWAAGCLLIIALISTDIKSESSGVSLLSLLMDRLRIRSRRARWAGRNLFCGSFIASVLACMVFSPNAML